ncbi:MAG: hypothetical protein IPK16_31175 [Anaerolineales bacterium]|nr:hypothetical protein [Anaerolineales bacterium]
MTRLVINQVDKVLPYLSRLPAVDALVRAEINKILPQLVNSPEIQTLIRAQAAQYITYLQAHP